MTTRHLITTVPQVDGGTRELYAPTARAAREARATLREDPTMIDHLGRTVVTAIVDVERDGSRHRVR